MIVDALLLLLPLAAVSGWYAAKRNSHDLLITPPKENTHFTRDYLAGLNYLLNEQPDKAIDVFIKMLEIDSETVETHLALGALFRRRGEVERAIRIHQNVIARPQLPGYQRIEALLALGKDYLRAGLFDRAERVFLEVSDGNKSQIMIAKRHLLDIYQQQKQWDQAIAIANTLEDANQEIAVRVAHYHCELVEAAIASGQLAPARALLKQALNAHPKCVRASLLQGDIEAKAGDFKTSLQAYQRVREQDPDYLNEVVAPLATAHVQLEDKDGLLAYLQDSLQIFPRTSLTLTLMESIQYREGDAAAIDFMTGQLHQRPSLRGLQSLIALQIKAAAGQAGENLLILKELIDRLLKNKSVYRCGQCGYAGKVLHWLCPGCKTWETTKPILGVEGE